MKNFKTFILLLLLFSIQNLKSQNILPPEKVFDLYFNSFVRYDDDSLKELNSYLINFLGKENTHKMNLGDTYKQRVDYFTQIFLSTLPADMASSCKEEATNYFCVLIDNFKEAKCSIKCIKSIQKKVLKDQEVSEVVFEVSFKVSSNVPELHINDIKKGGADEMRKYLTDLTIHLKKADKIVKTEQKFNLYQMKNGDDIYYWNGGPQELTWKLNEFYFKNIK